MVPLALEGLCAWGFAAFPNIPPLTEETVESWGSPSQAPGRPLWWPLLEFKIHITTTKNSYNIKFTIFTKAYCKMIFRIFIILWDHYPIPEHYHPKINSIPICNYPPQPLAPTIYFLSLLKFL